MTDGDDSTNTPQYDTKLPLWELCVFYGCRFIDVATGFRAYVQIAATPPTKYDAEEKEAENLRRQRLDG